MRRRPILDGQSEAWLPAAVAGLGAGLLALHLATTVVTAGVRGVFESRALGGHLLPAGLAVAILGAALALARGDVDPERYPRVAAWCLGGLAVVLALNLPLIGLYGFDSIASNLQWAIFAASLGSLGGLVVGYVEARAIDRAIASERAAVRTDAIEAQRDWLDYLNGLLRHEVLNTANVIEGYADLLMEAEVDPPDREHVETIRRKSRDMS